MSGEPKINLEEQAQARMAGLTVEELRSKRQGEKLTVPSADDEDWSPNKETLESADEGWQHKGTQKPKPLSSSKPKIKITRPQKENREVKILPTAEQCEILQEHPDYKIFKEGMRLNVFEQLKDSGLNNSEKEEKFQQFCKEDLQGSVAFLQENGELKDWEQFVKNIAGKVVVRDYAKTAPELLIPDLKVDIEESAGDYFNRESMHPLLFKFHKLSPEQQQDSGVDIDMLFYFLEGSGKVDNKWPLQIIDGRVISKDQYLAECKKLENLFLASSNNEVGGKDSEKHEAQGGKEEFKSLAVITLNESKKILDKLSIRGYPFKGKRLDSEILKQANLEPKYRVERQGIVDLYLSQPYKIDEGRIAVVGYVDSGKGPVGRTFYRSNSQGVWRYLPSYLMQGGEIEWYHKGHGEESITLPVEYQKVLAEISKSEGEILEVEDPNLIFAGTAREMAGAMEKTEPITMLVEVSAQPVKINGNFYPPSRDKRVAPEQVDFFDTNIKPDFSKVLESWVQPSSLYGPIEVEIFSSNDNSLKYMFCRDSKGRAWVGGVENDSEITSTGVKEEWVSAGDLTTPAYEYFSQANGYGSAKYSKGSYVDMYEKYVSKIPVVKEYLASLANR